MGAQNHYFVFESTLHTLFENQVRYVGVHCAQRVIKQVNLSVAIDGPGQGDPGFLSSRYVDSAFTDGGVDSLHEEVHIAF